MRISIKVRSKIWSSGCFHVFPPFECLSESTNKEQDEVLRELFAPALLDGMEITTSEGKGPTGWMMNEEPVSVRVSVGFYRHVSIVVDLRSIAHAITVDGRMIHRLRSAMLLTWSPVMVCAYLCMKAHGLPHDMARLVVSCVLGNKVLCVSRVRRLDLNGSSDYLEIDARFRTRRRLRRSERKRKRC